MLFARVGRDLSEQHASCGFDLQIAVGSDFSVESNRRAGVLRLCGAAGGFGGFWAWPGRCSSSKVAGFQAVVAAAASSKQKRGRAVAGGSKRVGKTTRAGVVFYI